jgi:hypothetical protein
MCSEMASPRTRRLCRPVNGSWVASNVADASRRRSMAMYRPVNAPMAAVEATTA